VTTAATPTFETKNDLPPELRGRVAELLNQRLADAVDLAAQAKHAHWNVKGVQFNPLHLLFDSVHDAVEDYADLLAERVVQLGGVALGTVRVAAGRSILAEYPAGAVDGLEHVSAMAAVLSTFGGRMRRAIDETGSWGDQDSADLCTEISRGTDKWLWMVEAHGQGRPTLS
jgi:starvation-inducible DNA-binding protein